MYVSEQHKALILNVKNPAPIVECIPKAKLVPVKGKNIVVIKHGLDEVRVLRNLGIRAPSPILHHYEWKGKYKPYEHQRQTAAFLTTHQRGLVLNEIGTGKTQAALWAADYLMQIGQVKKCLIISPLSTLERVWGDGIYMNFVDRRFVTLHGSAARRKKLLNTEHDFYIINHDGFAVIFDEIQDMFDLVIVDEAAVYRTPNTQRFKLFRKFLANHPNVRLWMMTGTPTPNSPTDAWSLARLIGSPYCTKTYTAFRDQVMMKVSQWKYVPRPESVDIVKEVLQPSIRYTRDQCFDLPDTVIQTREVPLTKEQSKHYKQMLRTFTTELGADGSITAVNEAVKLQKLVQIACGVAYGDNGSHIEIDCSPRVKLVKEIIEQAGEKVIVFVPLTGTLKMLEKELSKDFTVAVVNGAVSSGKRNQIFHDFQHSRDPHVLVAHPATMAHGLTLTSASTIVWYGPVTSNEQYVQANGRVERIGKKHVSNVVHIESTDLEARMYERLRNKQKLQGLLLDLIQGETGD